MSLQDEAVKRVREKLRHLRVQSETALSDYCEKQMQSEKDKALDVLQQIISQMGLLLAFCQDECRQSPVKHLQGICTLLANNNSKNEEKEDLQLLTRFYIELDKLS